MQQNAPQAEWIQGAITVEQTGAEARREFIRKTYVHFLIGLMAFCGVVFGIMSSPPLIEAMFGVSPWIWLVAMIGLSLMYRSFFGSANMTVHYVGYGLTILFQGAFTAPLFYWAHHFYPEQNILRDAFMLTALGFGGLTGFVLISKKDFSFMGGMLSVATWLIIGVVVLSLIAGFSLGLLFSAFILLVFGGWVLYDTSQIQRHLPLNGYVFGATMLFIDFVVMLRQVVWILASLAGDD